MPKAPLVHKLIYILLISFSTFSCKSQITNTSDDVILFNQVLKNNIEHHKEQKKYVSKSNDNSNIIDIIEELKKNEENINTTKLDSLKNNYGIENNEIFNSIFNKKEYNYLLSQHQKSEWDFNLLKVNKSLIQKNLKVGNGLKIFIAKPIYTLNKKYALVATNSFIVIYQKMNNKWEEYKIFNAGFH